MEKPKMRMLIVFILMFAVSGCTGITTECIWMWQSEKKTPNTNIKDPSLKSSNSFSGSNSNLMFITTKEDNGFSFDGINDYLSVGDVSFETFGGYACTGICYDATDKVIWSVNFSDEKLHKLNEQGNILATIRLASGSKPQGVCVDYSDNTLWYADHGNFYIRHIQKDGTEITGDAIDLTDVSYAVNGIAYDSSDDTLWFTINGSSLIYHYQKDGTPIGTITIADVSNNLDGLDYDLTDDSIYVCSDYDDQVINIDAATGIKLSAFETSEDNIEDVAVNNISDMMWISHDSGYHARTPQGNRISKWTKSGQTIDSFDFSGNHPFSLAIGVKFKDNRDVQSIVSKGDHLSRHPQWTLELLGATMKLRFFGFKGSAPKGLVTPSVSQPALSIDQWYLIVATYDGNIWNMYVDNVLVDSTTDNSSLTPTIYPVNIGRRNSVSGFKMAYIDLEYVAIFSKALSANERKRLWNDRLLY